MTEPIFLLKGVAGSTAHGLATADSDEDLYGVYVWPRDSYLGLDAPLDSIVGNTPQDHTFHEIGKYLRLALKANPTVLELLYLKDYESESYWGGILRTRRRSLLSTNAVQSSYLGYAYSQFKKLEARDGSFSSATKNRTAKHAKHLFRLLEQGSELLTTGYMHVKVKDPQRYFDIMEMSVPQLSTLYAAERAKFDDIKSVLPDHPDREMFDKLLIAIRNDH